MAMRIQRSEVKLPLLGTRRGGAVHMPVMDHQIKRLVIGVGRIAAMHRAAAVANRHISEDVVEGEIEDCDAQKAQSVGPGDKNRTDGDQSDAGGAVEVLLDVHLALATGGAGLNRRARQGGRHRVREPAVFTGGRVSPRFGTQPPLTSPAEKVDTGQPGQCIARNASRRSLVEATVRRTFLSFLLVFVCSVTAVQADILPVSKIQKGMKGYGLTVFEGNKIEKFDVEILGVLEKIGPDQDLILARVDSDLVRSTGIIAGMSGSPIYIDGKVIGALAYAWQFSKEPVAAITPIEEMLRLDKNLKGSAKVTRASPVSAAEFLKTLRNPESDHLAKLFAAVSPTSRLAAMGALPIAVPVSFAGFSGETISRFAPLLETSGFLAVPAGTSAASKSGKETSKTFAPGDAIGAVLIDGDFSVAATGTVTHVNKDQVFGFGHPFLDLGEINFPMARSEVVAIMPSLARSFKFANTGNIIGALRQDRSAGIFGQLGAEADLIPVELQLDDTHGGKTYRFRVVRDSLLFPLMVAMVTDSVVTSAQRAAGERTLRLDCEINLDGFKPIRIRDGFAGIQARQAIPMYLAVVANYLLSNEFHTADIESMKIQLRHDDELKIAKLIEASIDTPADGFISPGDTVRLRTVLKPYRGESFTESFEVKIPANQKLGTANLFVGSGTVANQLDFSLVPPDPRNLAQVVAVLERLRSATDLTVGLYSSSDGAVTAGVFLPNLPPSIQAVISADTSNAEKTAVKYHAPDQMVRPLDYIIEGALKVEIPIRQRI